MDALLERSCAAVCADFALAFVRYANGGVEVVSFGPTPTRMRTGGGLASAPATRTHGAELRLASVDGNAAVLLHMTGLHDVDIDLVLGRSNPAQPMTVADLRRLRPFSPWIADGLRLWVRTRQLVDHAALYERAFHLAANELMLVRADGEIVAISAAARARLGSRDGIADAAGKIVALELKSDIRLRTVIAHGCRPNPREAGPDAVQVVTVTRGNKRPLIVAVTPLAVSVAGNAGCAFLQVVDPEQPFAGDVGIACAVNGVSGAEARVARLLAVGYSLTEAAAELQIRPDTARTYLKQVFIKTGVNRQAALVQLLRASMVSAAPGHALNLL